MADKNIAEEYSRGKSPDQEDLELTLSVGGSISGEHGIALPIRLYRNGDQRARNESP